MLEKEKSVADSIRTELWRHTLRSIQPVSKLLFFRSGEGWHNNSNNKRIMEMEKFTQTCKNNESPACLRQQCTRKAQGKHTHIFFSLSHSDAHTYGEANQRVAKLKGKNNKVFGKVLGHNMQQEQHSCFKSLEQYWITGMPFFPNIFPHLVFWWFQNLP